MNTALTDWLAEDAEFASREACVAVLNLLLEKQCELLNSGLSQGSQAAHYLPEVAEFEQLARLMWGAVPAGAESARFNRFLATRLARGLAPQSLDFWGTPVNYDQRVVEMSSVAVAMIDAGELYFAPLDEQARQHLFDWFGSVTQLELPPNNWRWFRILILSALEKLHGLTVDQQAAIERDFALLEESYLEHGWYQDGPSAVLDYYNPFAFHLYGLIYARWYPDTPRSQTLIARAREFAAGYQLWFGDDGAQLVYGRSLNYRFAGAGFWAELAGLLPSDSDEMGQLRGLWARNMRWWARQPIWHSDGQLSSGFAYPNLLASEFYTSPASPVLAFKAFSALRLPADHPFWQAQEQPVQQEVSPVLVAGRHLLCRRGGSYLLSNAPASGELRHCADKYLKFAYSSDHGLSVEGDRWIDQGFAGDNLLAFKHPQTGSWYSRSRLISSESRDNTLISVWQPFEGCRVTTEQFFTVDREVRTHRIEADQKLEFLATGHAADTWRPWFSHLEPGQRARTEGERLFSELVPVTGAVRPSVYPCAPNTNLLYAHASVPALGGSVEPGETLLEYHVLAGRRANKNGLQ